MMDIYRKAGHYMLKDEPSIEGHGTISPPIKKIRLTTKLDNKRIEEAATMSKKHHTSLSIIHIMKPMLLKLDNQRSSNIFQIIYGCSDEYNYTELCKKSTQQLDMIATYVRSWIKYNEVVFITSRRVEDVKLIIGLINGCIATDKNSISRQVLWDADEDYYSMFCQSFRTCIDVILNEWTIRHNHEQQFLTRMSRLSEVDFYHAIAKKAKNDDKPFFDNYDCLPVSDETRRECLLSKKPEIHPFLCCYDYPVNLIQMRGPTPLMIKELLLQNSRNMLNSIIPATENDSANTKLLSKINSNWIKNDYYTPMNFISTNFAHINQYPSMVSQAKKKLLLHEEFLYNNDHGCFMTFPSIYRLCRVFAFRRDEYHHLVTKTNFFSRSFGYNILQGMNVFAQWNEEHRSMFIRFYFYLGFPHIYECQECVDNPILFISLFPVEDHIDKAKCLDVALCGFFRQACEQAGLEMELACPESTFVHRIVKKNIWAFT